MKFKKGDQVKDCHPANRNKTIIGVVERVDPDGIYSVLFKNFYSGNRHINFPVARDDHELILYADPNEILKEIL